MDYFPEITNCKQSDQQKMNKECDAIFTFFLEGRLRYFN